MFHNFDDFVNKIKIPFYEDYSIRIVNDTDNPNSLCFGDGSMIKINFLVMLFAILYIMF